MSSNLQEATVDDATPASTPPKDDRPLWKRVMPFAIAAALIVYLVWNLDLQAFVQHLRQVNYPYFLGFVALFVIALLATDSWATAFIYSKTVCRIGFKELFLIRGASYLPSMLNHHVGQAWLTWYLSKKYSAPLWRVTGATLLSYASIFGVLFMFGGMSLLFDHSAATWLGPMLGAVTVAGVVYLAIIHKAPKALAQKQLFAPLFDVGVVGHLQALAIRVPHMIVLFLGSWLSFRFFEVDIPPGAAFAYVPVLMVVAALPITPQGVGTRDWFSVHYFTQYGAGTPEQQKAAVVAATMSFAVAISLLQAVFAVWLMHRALKVLNAPAQGAPDKTSGDANTNGPVPSNVE